MDEELELEHEICPHCDRPIDECGDRCSHLVLIGDYCESCEEEEKEAFGIEDED